MYQRKNFVRPLFAVAMVAASTIYAIAQQPPSPTRVRGSIEAVNGDLLAVKSRGGEGFSLRMTPDIRIVGITKIALADIKVGSFIGTTTVPGSDGNQNAVEVHVFPEDMRGTGEGSRPYDLRPNSTMTNATVAQSVVGNDGHTLLVKYKDGEKKVAVSAETPVVTPPSLIRDGSYSGATTMPGTDGNQNAVEVHVFPEDQRGAGEGLRPCD